MIIRNTLCRTTLLVLLSLHSASAQWLQWGGPNRNFTVETKGLKDKWPDGGPKKLWQRELGDGYSTILVDGDMLYTMYRAGQEEFTIALDAKTGKTLWEHKVFSPTTPVMEEYGAGPSATPLIVGDKLYSVGTNMMLHCFNKKTGDVIWKKSLADEFGASIQDRGYTCSPLAYKDTIILPITKAGHGLTAFHPDTGSVIWSKGDFGVTHSSPIIIRFEGEDQLVYFTADSLIGVNPSNGELLWGHEHKTQYGANLMTPLWNGKDLIFCSAAYDSGARVVKLSKKDGKTVPEQLWFSKKMRLHHGNAVTIGDHVYGSSGDFGPAFFMAAEWQTGKTPWRARGFKKATCVHGDGKMIILDEDGNLSLATATPEALEVHSSAKVGELYSWAAPTLVGTKLYLRDRKHIWAFDVG